MRYTNPFCPQRALREVGPRDAAQGFSLVELIFASFLVLIIAVGILPLFMRAVQNNAAGSSSSQIVTHLRASLEDMQHAELDQLVLGDKAAAPDSNNQYLEVPITSFFTGPLDSVGGGDKYLGDEGWIDEDEETGEGFKVWEREVKVWYHPLPDVLPGLVTVGADTTGTTFETLGHPDLFDDPVNVAQGRTGGNLVRIEMTVRSARQDDQGNRLSGPVSRYQDLRVSRVRAY